MERLRRLSALLLTLSLLSLISVSAYALETPELGRRGSISVTMTYEGEPVTGGTLTLYRVGELSGENGGCRFVFTGDFAACEDALENLESSELAERLRTYAVAKGLNGAKREIKEDGTALYSDLELGLYLMVQEEAANGYQAAAPFLVSLPLNQDQTYVYNVDASPKLELTKETASPEPDTPITPTEPIGPDTPATPAVPTDSTRTTLPQTGQLNWPVPVLAALGLCLFLAGWALCFGKKGNSNGT